MRVERSNERYQRRWTEDVVIEEEDLKKKSNLELTEEVEKPLERGISWESCEDSEVNASLPSV